MKRWGILLSIFALLVIVGGGIAHFFFGTPVLSAQDRSIGVNVSVMGSNAPAGIKAVADPVRSPFTMAPLGPAVDITPAGKIHGSPVTLRFKLSKRVTSQGVLLAVRETANGDWTLIKPVVSSDGWYASVTTAHLSTWQPLGFDLNQAATDFRKNFLDGLSGDLTTVADKPTCANESQARQDGYTITSSAKVTLYWCFGVEDGARVLKIVNRMRYPLEVQHPGLTIKHLDGINLDLDQLARIGSGKTTILYPFEEADYTLNLSPGSKAGLVTAYSGYAQSLYQLETGVSTLGAVLSGFGAEDIGIADLFTSKGLKTTMGIMDSLLAIKDCLNAMFPPDAGKVISGCFTPADIMDALGWKGLLLAPIMALGSILEFFRSEVSSFVDILKNTPSYAVIVSRSNPQAVLATYAGSWHVHGYDLTINADGTGHDIWHDGFSPTGVWCNGNDTIAFTVMSDGSLVGTVQASWYTPQGEDCTPGSEQPGGHFSLVHQGEHLLYQTWSDINPQYNSNYLCDPYASGAGWQQCGA